jgi:hypothetical protein
VPYLIGLIVIELIAITLVIAFVVWLFLRFKSQFFQQHRWGEHTNIPRLFGDDKQDKK